MGGTDTIIKHGLKDASQSVKLATRIVRRSWPYAIKVNISDTERLMYRTQGDEDDWEKNGSTPTNGVNLIHILADDNTVTIVHDGNLIIINSIRIAMRETLP